MMMLLWELLGWSWLPSCREWVKEKDEEQIMNKRMREGLAELSLDTSDAWVVVDYLHEGVRLGRWGWHTLGSSCLDVDSADLVRVIWTAGCWACSDGDNSADFAELTVLQLLKELVDNQTVSWPPHTWQLHTSFCPKQPPRKTCHLYWYWKASSLGKIGLLRQLIERLTLQCDWGGRVLVQSGGSWWRWCRGSIKVIVSNEPESQRTELGHPHSLSSKECGTLPSGIENNTQWTGHSE